MILLGSLQGSLRQYEQHEIAFLDTNNNFKHIYLYASACKKKNYMFYIFLNILPRSLFIDLKIIDEIVVIGYCTNTEESFKIHHLSFLHIVPQNVYQKDTTKEAPGTWSKNATR